MVVVGGIFSSIWFSVFFLSNVFLNFDYKDKFVLLFLSAFYILILKFNIIVGLVFFVYKIIRVVGIRVVYSSYWLDFYGAFVNYRL